jgi:hypothetical protein
LLSSIHPVARIGNSKAGPLIGCIGGHLVRYPCDQRYRNEPEFRASDIGLKRVEPDIISDIGINFDPIPDIPVFIDQHCG